MVLVENSQNVQAVAPADYTGAAATPDVVSMKYYNRLQIKFSCGAWAAGTAAVTISQCTNVAAAGAKALAFSWQWTNVADTATDVLTKTAVTSNTFNLSAANATHIVEIKAEDLDVDNGFDCVRVNVASPGANSDIYGVEYVLYEPRYAPTKTAITN